MALRAVHLFAQYVPVAEGISRNVGSLVAALARAGADATLDAEPVELQQLNRRRARLAFAVRGQRRLRRHLAANQCDVVHQHVSLAAAAFLAKRARQRAPGHTPLLLHAWNAYLDPAASPFVPAADLWAHRVANGPRIARLALRGIPHVAVSSQFQAEQLRRVGFDGQLHVVPNGVDTKVFQPASPDAQAAARQTLGLGSGPTILYYGHSSSWKGLDSLMAGLPGVLRERPDAQAILALTPYGGREQAVRERLERTGLSSRVRLLGVTHVPTVLAAADIVAVPSLAAVGTACHPNVILEAMAAGKLVVASRVGSVPEVLEHEVNGLMVPPGEPAALRAALLQALDDPAASLRMARQAHLWARGHDWDQVAGRMLETYRRMGVEGVETPRRPLVAEAR